MDSALVRSVARGIVRGAVVAGVNELSPLGGPAAMRAAQVVHPEARRPSAGAVAALDHPPAPTVPVDVGDRGYAAFAQRQILGEMAQQRPVRVVGEDGAVAAVAGHLAG